MIKTIVHIGIGFIVLMSVLTSLNGTIQAEDTTIVWTAIIYGNESNGSSDYVEFGEASTANDGPPADMYDIVKPPPPMTPYLRLSFNDNIPAPYNLLWKDYRHNSGTVKIWNLTVQWTPRDHSTSTEVTISWDPLVIGTSGYTSVMLYTTTGILLKNMLLNSNYSFICYADSNQNFMIIGQRTNNLPGTPENPIGEVMGYHGLSYSYSTSTTDLDGDDLYYQFDWGTSIMGEWLGPYQSGQRCNINHTWETPGLYAVKVKARDSNGAESNWSQPLTVEMSNRAPYEPSAPSPLNGSTQVQINPTLHWTSSDPDNDIVTYDVYFGENTTPPKIISGQTDVSFTPSSLQYQTTYYWKIIAKDPYNANTSSVLWSFETKAPDSGSPGNNEEPGEENLPPVANASASDTNGLVGVLLVFNGSRSVDPDGYLTSWSWDFGDGTTGAGEKTSHMYQTIGSYRVILTVTDNDHVTDTDTFVVSIITANYPPTQPVIEGITLGIKNTMYTYTVRSTDADNDFIQYTVNWGDTTQNSSEFIPNGTICSFQHAWSSSGKYNIFVTASDNSTISEQATYTMFIDVYFIGSYGFLYDQNNDAVLDSFYTNATSVVTTVERLENGSYVFTIDNESLGQYLFDPNTGSFNRRAEGESPREILWIVLIIGIAAFVSIILLFLYKKRP